MSGINEKGPLIWHVPRRTVFHRKGLWNGTRLDVPVLSIGKVDNSGLRKRHAGVQGFLYRKMGLFSWWEKLRLIYEMTLLVRVPFFIYLDNEDARLLWAPTEGEMELMMGDRNLIFQHEVVPCGMTPPVEIELSNLGYPTGLNCGAFLARTEFFNDLREDLVELVKEGPGGMAYPEDTEYPRPHDPDAGNPGFLDRSAFQYLTTIFPGDISIDVDENYIVRWPSWMK